MNATNQITLRAEVPRYAALQREMHDALIAQHPEWVEDTGACPTCDDYDRRFAELLGLSLGFQSAQERKRFTR